MAYSNQVRLGLLSKISYNQSLPFASIQIIILTQLGEHSQNTLWPKLSPEKEIKENTLP
jgi:hypothetical protein